MVSLWILTGTPKNWEIALSQKIRGFQEPLNRDWENIQKNDVVIFYASSPISGVIGIGKVKNKFKQDSPLWPEELKKRKVIWKYRFEFEVIYALPISEWQTKKVEISDLRVGFWKGINRIRNLKEGQRLLERLEFTWKIEIPKIMKKREKRKRSLHEEIKEKLLELGRIEGNITEKEYEMPDIKERLDIVWRKIPTSVPTYVFEVQIGGNVHQALSKLKHAFDIWNSNIFLITDEKNLNKVKALLSGTFHEIQHKIRVISVSQFNKLYKLQKEDDELKRKFGLR